MTPRDPSIPPKRAISTRDLVTFPGLEEVLELRGGQGGLDRPIEHPRVQKGGLVLAGHLHGAVATRVQVFGETECSFLESLDPEICEERLEAFLALQLSCLVVTRGVDPAPVLRRIADRTDSPLFVSSRRSSHTIAEVHHALDRLLAPSTQVHGVFVDVYGVGVLLQGPSGVGKSECALALIERGHRLVADDVVVLHRKPTGEVEGAAPGTLRDHLEVRGLGILNIRELFGATAVRSKKRVDLIVHLKPWEQGEAYERLGFDDRYSDFLQSALPTVEVPVSAGRDMGLIVEVAARDRLLRSGRERGSSRLEQRLSEGLGLVREEPEPRSEGHADPEDS